MIGLLILLIVGGMLSFIFQKDVEDVLPSFVMTLLLGIYGLAILKKSHHAYMLSLVVFFMIVCLFAVILLKRRSSINVGALIAWPAKHIGFICFLLTCLLMIYCYSSHFVFVWDDFHYNATFPKDCFYYGTMPTGMALATYYKSYLPLMQLFFYWGFQGSGFSEPLMFQYKIVLVYVLILPIFKRVDKTSGITRISTIVFAVILPFLFMYEIQESLSMDTVVAGLFAYTIVLILFEETRDLFFIYRVVSALLCLTLMKTISVIFAGICLGAWLVVILEKKERNYRIRELYGLLAATVSVVIAYFSWVVFCRINGNTTYLTEKLISNTSEDTVFPPYATDTIVNMLKNLAVMHLNLGPTGLSFLGVVFFAFTACVVLVITKKFSRIDFINTIVLTFGFIGYFTVLCYTFLFVFEPWEAEELSSFDRYIGTYALAVCYVFYYRLTFIGSEDRDQVDKIEKWALPILVICVIFTLPFSRLVNVLIPSRYVSSRADIYHVREEVHDEMNPFMSTTHPTGIMMIVNDAGNSVYSRSIDYEIIPHIAREFNLEEYEPSEVAGKLEERVKDVHPDYIYFTERERKKGDISKFKLPKEYDSLDGVEGMFQRVR